VFARTLTVDRAHPCCVADLRTGAGGLIIQVSPDASQVIFRNSMYHATKMGIEGFKAGGNVEVIRKPSPLRPRGLETGLWEVVKRALLGAVSTSNG